MADYFQLLSAFAVVFLALYYYFTSTFDFWKIRGVPGPRPLPILGNNMHLLRRKKQFGVMCKELYDKYKSEPMVGIFLWSTPGLILRDLDLIKDVLIKDFSIFSCRGIVINGSSNPSSLNLFALEARRWRPLRARLSPVFTTGKLKEMFPLIIECAEHLEKHLGQAVEKAGPVDCREIAAKFTTDVIGSCAFGIEMNALSNEESEFRRMGRKIFENNFIMYVRGILREVTPQLFNLLSYILPQLESLTFFTKVISDTIDYRKKNNIVRPDFINMLIDLKDHPEKLEGMETTDALLTAQALIFFAAGFETSSTTISHALYEMALNPEMQDKLRAEIRECSAKKNGDFNYDTVKNMEYLDKIFKETLRKYPSGTSIRRKPSTSYTFNGTKVTITKDTIVTVPVYAIHRDPSLYPDPDVFNPERFDKEAEAARHPMSYLPFGDGPRNCIGARFAIFQTKIGLIKMLQNFRFDVCEKTLIPYIHEPVSQILCPKGGIYLKVSKVKN